METYNLRPVELMFAIKLQRLIEKNADINTFTKIGYLTGYSASRSKSLCYSLRSKGIIECISSLGASGRTEVKILVNPMTLINA